jgi:hypothetical protein
VTDRLFGDGPRTDLAKSPYRLSTFAFLDRTADPAFSRVRDLLEDWFSAYPSHEQRDLRGRIASKDDGQFDAAFLELYLYVVHRALGFEAEAHPDLPSVTSHPDFRVTCGGESLLIEATIPENGPKARGREQRRAQVVDAIDKLDAPDFGLQFEIKKEGAEPPTMRDVARRVSRWLDGLDWSEVRAQFVQHKNPYLLPARVDRAGAWAFSFRAWPRSPSRRGRGGGAIMLGPSGGGAFAHDEMLLTRLERKAKKYGDDSLEEPLVIAVRLDGMSVRDQDVVSALYGRSIGVWDRSTSTVEPTSERGEGLWHRDGKPRNRQVTGVLAYSSELRPWSVSRERPTLWLHPNAARPLPTLPWDQAVLTADGSVVRTPGSFDPREVFALPGVDEVDGGADAWPGEAFRS